MGGEQGFANQPEKNIYSNLGVVSKLRTHRLRLQVANTAKGDRRNSKADQGVQPQLCKALRC